MFWSAALVPSLYQAGANRSVLTDELMKYHSSVLLGLRNSSVVREIATNARTTEWMQYEPDAELDTALHICRRSIATRTAYLSSPAWWRSFDTRNDDISDLTSYCRSPAAGLLTGARCWFVCVAWWGRRRDLVVDVRQAIRHRSAAHFGCFYSHTTHAIHTYNNRCIHEFGNRQSLDATK